VKNSLLKSKLNNGIKMAKRITAERVKKWSVASGLVGVPVALGLIWFMVFLGSIDVTGFSGDVVCDGTEIDPCIALINFTVNEDVFLYPSGEWSETAFYTDKQPKSVKMFRSWGKGWREIKMNQSCTGTWCGLSSSKDERKFSFAFREGRNYTLKYELLKNSPDDTIKWGFGPVDPIFFGREDNKLVYTDNDLKVLITDALDNKLGDVKLDSHKEVNEIKKIPIGVNSPVMWYDFTNWSNYSDGLTGVEFIDMNTGKKVNKSYYFAVLNYENISVNDTSDICFDDIRINETINICNKVVIGEHTEIREQWVRLNTGDILDKGVKIALITDVNRGDYFDGIWTIANKQLTKHALWAAEDGITVYFNFSTSGTTTSVVNAHTTELSSHTSNGKITGGAISCNGVDEDITMGTFNDASYTTNFWFNVTSYATTNLYGKNGPGLDHSYTVSLNASGSPNCGYDNGASGFSVTSNDPISLGNWHMVTCMMNVTGMNLFVDGTLKKSNANPTNVIFSDGEKLAACCANDGDVSCNSVADLDEFVLWNQSLSSTDISDLYNGGAGLVFGSGAPGDLTVPNVTINSPLNITYFISTILFNVTAVDETQMGSCLGTVNGGLTNFTLINLTTSVDDYTLTNTSVPQGSYIFTAYCNDTSNNLNNTESITFTVGFNLTGFVKDFGGSFLADANIVIINQSDNIAVANVTSNGSGFWTYGPIPAGNYTIVGYLNSTLDGDAEPFVVMPRVL
jgi:hypothetical protein